MKASIMCSAVGPTLSEQCDLLGVVSAGMPLERADRISDALAICNIAGVLTDAETDRARKRLLKAMRLQEPPK